LASSDNLTKTTSNGKQNYNIQQNEASLVTEKRYRNTREKPKRRQDRQKLTFHGPAYPRRWHSQ